MYRRLLGVIVILLALMLAGSAAALGESQPTANTYTGTLTIIVGDPMPVEGQPMLPVPPIFTLNLADGREMRLLPGAAGEDELLRLAGQRVSVTVPAAEAERSLAGDPYAVPGVAVTSAALAPGAVMLSPEVSGNTKWLSIACKFADVADQPKTMSYFRNMYASTYPGLDHYWREASYGAMNVSGSTAVGWYTLPKPKSAYQIDSYELKWKELFLDCAALADPQVNFAEYYGVHLMLNSSAHCCATATMLSDVTLDNVSKSWPVTFIPPWGYADIAVIQHEMAHGLGLWWHSYSGTNAYGSPWDVLSDDFYGCGPRDPVFGCVGQHTVTYNRSYLGWIPEARQVTVSPGVTTLTLERTTQPSPTGYLMAIVPIKGSSIHYYTIEARQKVGYDTKLPGASIVIHEIGGYQRLQLMDPFAAAERQEHFWVVSDTWYAPVGNISVHVDATTPTGVTITVDTRWMTQEMMLVATGDTTLDQAAPDANFGHEPQLRIEGSLWNDNGATKAFFLKFDSSQLPPRITRVSLWLSSIGYVDGQRLLVFPPFKNGYGYGATWDEYSLTWNSFMEEWTSPFGTPIVYRPTYATGSLFEFDITGLLAVAGNNAVRALIVDDFRDYPLKTFSSREGANTPHIYVQSLVRPDEPTTYTFAPTNDATVNQAKPQLVSGNKPTLQVKDAAKDLNAYVKFNVVGLDGAVQSATLRLWVTNGGPDGGRVYATSPFYPGTSTQWLETGLKWNNAPAVAGVVLDTAGVVVAGRWIELDVTGAVVGNGRASFALTNDNADLVVYSSKEGAHAPELIVVTD